jgi:RimJ/RimL family protein N-acetyltransferase
VYPHALTLRDGAEVRVRPIEPSDRDALAAAFERLSDESRYRRFLGPVEHLGPSMLRYLTEVDNHDHEALAAFDRGGNLVGVGRWVRERDGPGDRAEAAVTVADDWQGRGLGTALTALIAERALDEGIDRFTATMLAENREMLDLLTSVGSVAVTGREGSTVEVEVALEPERPGAGRGLYRLLRATASRVAAIADPLLPGGGPR